MFYFMQAFRNYADFKTRTSRKAFWMYQLFFFIFYTILVVLQTITTPLQKGDPQSVLNIIFSLILLVFILATFIPNLAIQARRLHDINRTGWWILINLIPLVGLIVCIVFWCQPSDAGANKYGEPANDLKPGNNNSNTAAPAA